MPSDQLVGRLHLVERARPSSHARRSVTGVAGGRRARPAANRRVSRQASAGAPRRGLVGTGGTFALAAWRRFHQRRAARMPKAIRAILMSLRTEAMVPPLPDRGCTILRLQPPWFRPFPAARTRWSRFRPRGGERGRVGIRDSAAARPRPGRRSPGGDRLAHARAGRARRRHLGSARRVGQAQARVRDRAQGRRELPPPAFHVRCGHARRGVARPADRRRGHAPHGDPSNRGESRPAGSGAAPAREDAVVAPDVEEEEA